MWGLDAVCMCLCSPHVPLWGPELEAANINGGLAGRRDDAGGRICPGFGRDAE